jgi:hypothetical protein
VLCSRPRHGRLQWKLRGWLAGVGRRKRSRWVCKGAAGQRRRQQHHRLWTAKLSRQHHRRPRWRWKKHIPMGACNLRVVTGLGWASCLAGVAGTADRQRKSQTTKARSRRPVGLGQARYWHSRIGETLTRYLSEGFVARWIERDKLGMMRCVVPGRSFQVPRFARSKRPDTAPWVARPRDGLHD